jgi:hypothetical protein
MTRNKLTKEKSTLRKVLTSPKNKKRKTADQTDESAPEEKETQGFLHSFVLNFYL